MNKIIFFLFFLTGFFSCSIPIELSVPDDAKSADNFSRAFIDKIISGQIQRSFADIDAEVLNDKMKDFITNASYNIDGAKLKKYRVVEVSAVSTLYSKTSEYTNYKFGYEYEFENSNILFTTTIKKQNGKLTVLSFDGQFLPAPLSELNKFTLSGKSATHYIFLILCVLIPLFVLATFIKMLFTKMSVKKKIILTLVILLVSFPSFVINWNNGLFDFSLLSLRFLGSSFYQPTLYSSWLLSFNIPIGAIVFWIEQKNLAKEKQH